MDKTRQHDIENGLPMGEPAWVRRLPRPHTLFYNSMQWLLHAGRSELLKRLPIDDTREQLLLEIGYGTVPNLQYLARRHSNLHLIGLDMASGKLARARRPKRDEPRRVKIYERPYPAKALKLARPVDLVLFSYSLSKFNPGWEWAISSAYADLPPGGCVAVVDFQDAAGSWLRQWLQDNNVCLDGHLLPTLQERFTTAYLEVKPVLQGSWQYFTFVGVKP